MAQGLDDPRRTDDRALDGHDRLGGEGAGQSVAQVAPPETRPRTPRPAPAPPERQDPQKSDDSGHDASHDQGGGKDKDGQGPGGGDEKGKGREKPKKPPFYKRPLAMLITVVVVLIAIVVGVIWFIYSSNHENTDDAFVDGDVVQVSPHVAGYIKTLYVNDNQKVKAGQPLLDIDPRDYQVQVAQSQASYDVALAKEKAADVQVELTQTNTQAAKEQATAGLRVAQAEVESAKAQYQSTQAEVNAAQAEAARAHQDLSRYENLSSEVVSRQTLDAAIAAARTADANVRSAQTKATAAESAVKEAESKVPQAQANLDVANTASQQLEVARAQQRNAQAESQRAKADLDAAKLNLSYCHIAAPCDGFVTKRSAVPGGYVQVDQALLAIVPYDSQPQNGQPAHIWITANFKETQLAKMQPGQPVEISVDAFSRKYKGKVDSIMAGSGARFSLLPPENATGNYVKVVQRVPVKIVLTEPNDENHLLSPGMSVEPNVDVGVRETKDMDQGGPGSPSEGSR